MSGFGGLTSKFRPTVKNPGLTFDSGLKLDKQIDSVFRATFLGRPGLEKGVFMQLCFYY